MTRNEARGVDLLASLEKRRDFLRCARGKKAVRRSFVLQMAARSRRTESTSERGASDAAVVRVGFTASRKIGGAVQRNRAKRRLRAAVRAVMPGRVLPGVDYVLVARRAVLTCRYADLEADLRSALADLAKARNRAAGRAETAAHGTSPGPASSPSTAR